MLHLNVVSPHRAFLDTECESVILPGKLGELQVLPGHVASLIELTTGLVSYKTKNHEPIRFMIAGGLVEIAGDQVNLLCELARSKAEIDRTKEESTQHELFEQIKSLSDADEIQHKRLSADLAKSVVSLQLLD